MRMDTGYHWISLDITGISPTLETCHSGHLRHVWTVLQTYLQDPEIQKVWNMQNALNVLPNNFQKHVMIFVYFCRNLRLEILWDLVEVDQPSLHVLPGRDVPDVPCDDKIRRQNPRVPRASQQ